MKTNEIRQRFFDYFVAQGHAMIPSSSLVPGDDPTLLFTNSGMVQFKDVFLGNESPSSPRAVTAQRCVRAGGKHNDLENVGYTARHHTFFEMLGNFSFGDYFKGPAIRYAWAFLTEELGLPPSRLWVTVFTEDDEAAKIWLDDIGVPPDRLRRIGAQDNFWSMGDTGPCGPCSEIFYDHGAHVPGGPPGSAEQEGDRYVEVWNLVFMQFNRSSDGALTPLPKPSVDTGLGLERVAAVLQGVHSNYEIDLFRNLIEAAADVLSLAERDHQSLRVIADHIRSTAFLIVDGVIPSNEGRGYVLRRIIRRAVRHGYQLGARQPFLHRLVAPLIAEMGEAYPELVAHEEQVQRVIRRENEKFMETLEQGLKILDREIAGLETAELKGDQKGKNKGRAEGRAERIIPGEVAFRLYDTFGFPVDLTADVAREHDLTLDLDGFERAMSAQRARARAASQFVSGALLSVDGVDETRFVGYQSLDSAARVLALFTQGSPETASAPSANTENAEPIPTEPTPTEPAPTDTLRAGEDGILVLDRTPFYAQSGGQVGDRGEIHLPEGVFVVEDTQYLANRVIAHIGRVARGRVKIGDGGAARVTADFRQDCANNHSATHLLHAALKAVLGSQVQQKGSLVDAQRLRFDFSHFEPLNLAQLAAVEGLVNRNIRANTPTTTDTMDLAQAKAEGAEALFGEKYGAQVRVVRMGAFSFELCGGTHVARSGDIGGFKVISESGIAAGVRRIEALSGAYAEDWVAQRLSMLDAAAAALKSSPEDISPRLKALLHSQRGQQRQIQSLQAQLTTAASPAQVAEVNGVQVVAVRQDEADAKTMRLAVDQWKQKLGSGVVLVAGVHDNKVILIAGVTRDLAAAYPAGELIRAVAPLVDGHGGGKPELAQGGGSKVEGVEQVLAAVPRWVAESNS